MSRGFSHNSMTLPLEKGAIVPTTKFLSWLKGKSEIGAVEKNGTQWFAVETGPWMYMLKTITGTYPNFRQVIPVDVGENRFTFTDDLSQLKRICQALPDTNKDGAVILSASPAGTLALCAAGADDNEISIELAGGTYAGNCKQYCLNRYYLMDALAAGFRTFTFADEFCPTVSDDGRGGKHIIMPMRFKSTAADVESGAQEQNAESNVTASTPAETGKTGEQPVETSVPTASNVCHEQIKPKTKGDRMSKQETTAIEKLQAAYEAAKDKVKEASASLADLAGLIKDALKEEKQRRVEIDNVRATVAKIQSIKV